MGGEFGQRREWAHEGELEWWVSALPEHGGVLRWVGELNRLYRAEPALHEIDFSHEGFEWIEANDAEHSAVAFLRKARSRAAPMVLVACNFTPVPRQNYVLGVPRGGVWREILNSDAKEYGGSGWGSLGGVEAAPLGAHGKRHSITVTLPPLSTVFFRSEANG
jgi:1,4-alpha-glucan branching enzyme